MQVQIPEEAGIVLSGGGVRGMAHIGVLQALGEHEIFPKWVSGTSVGALVGALYAAGKGTAEMLAFFSETPLFRYNFFSLNKPGLLDTERYYSIFKSFWPENSFESLQYPLYVIATDLFKGSEVIFHKGELIRPLLASAALPPIFSPVEIDTVLYADGGIMNNFPLEPLAGEGRYLIGSNVSVVKELTQKELRSSYQLANRTTALMIYAINRGKIRQCDLVFEPLELENIGVLDKKGIEKAYTIGYEHALKTLEQAGYPQTSS
jgi:NTE family protein